MTEHGSAWPTYRRLQAFGRPYRTLMIVGFIAMAIEAAAGGQFTRLMQPIIDKNFVSPQTRFDWTLPLLIVALFVGRGIAGYITDMAMARAGRSIARDLRVRVLSKYLRLPGQRFDSEPVPSMLTRLGSDSDQVALAAVDALKVMLQQSFQVIAMLVVMFWYSWRVTLAILVLAPPLGWVMDKVGRRYRRIGHRTERSARHDQGVA